MYFRQSSCLGSYRGGYYRSITLQQLLYSSYRTGLRTHPKIMCLYLMQIVPPSWRALPFLCRLLQCSCKMSYLSVEKTSRFAPRRERRVWINASENRCLLVDKPVIGLADIQQMSYVDQSLHGPGGTRIMLLCFLRCVYRYSDQKRSVLCICVLYILLVQ
jgi:hypothetical protein